MSVKLNTTVNRFSPVDKYGRFFLKGQKIKPFLNPERMEWFINPPVAGVPSLKIFYRNVSVRADLQTASQRLSLVSGQVTWLI
jgi:hypothetical protein